MVKIKFLILSIILIATFGCASSPQKEKEDNPVYQESIDLIKQGEWADARFKLENLRLINYKDSISLYYFVCANEEAQKSNYEMAIYYMKQIPDTYNGILKEQISLFKNEVNRRPNQIAGDSRKQLKLLSYKSNKISTAHIQVVGELKNVTDKKLDNVVVLVTFYDNNEKLITTAEAMTDFNPIMPDQISPFKVIATYNPSMDKFSIQFKYLTGEKILHDQD